MTNNKRPIKVLLVLPFFYPHRGGSQKYAEEIFAKLIKNHPNVSLDVLCYNTNNVTLYEKYRGFNVYRVPCWNIIPARFCLPKPLPLIKKLKELKTNNYDYVNTHIRFFDPTWWVWLYSKNIGAKSIYTGHIPSHPIHQNKFVEIIAKLADITVAKWSLKKYDYLTFVNKASKKFFEKELKVKKTGKLIYIAVDTKKFLPKKNELFSVPNTNKAIKENEILITYVGRVIKTKGIEILFTSSQKILHKNKSVKFVIAGPGELENKIRRKIRKKGLEDKIILTGSLNYDDVKKLLAATDIFVNPSYHSEGLPNTLLEAGASQCCVIATDVGGTKEVIINNQTGYLIPRKNEAGLTQALTNAINNKDKRELLAKNLREKVKNEFDWEEASEKLYSLLLQE